MNRYFLEVCYKGTNYAGFQVQNNATTIQSAVEAAFLTIFRQPVSLTGSSRTDAGVHARQNFFHFDSELDIQDNILYNLNALLPADIALRSIRKMPPKAHSRFDAMWRRYRYFIYRTKDPFVLETAYFYPYVLNIGSMREAAEVLKGKHDFTSFSKRNTQVKTFVCTIMESEWNYEDGMLCYHVKANRFLRGMVRGLVGTMLQVGRGKIDIASFLQVIKSGDNSQVDFAVPGKGLWLEEVGYPESYFEII